MFGEGAYYAPDLTKITNLRGSAYLTAYLRVPAKFYDETRHRRLMPKQDLSERDITDSDRLPRLDQQRQQSELAAASPAGHRSDLPRHRPEHSAADPARASRRTTGGAPMARG